nr:cell surface protein SprA [candidate division Zixibacteria bacterium]
MIPQWGYSAPPGFRASLETPSGDISPYPEERVRFIASISKSDYPQLRMIYTVSPKVDRSSFEDNTLTFTSSYYKKSVYNYEYVPRTVDATDYLTWRRSAILNMKMNESRAQALSKQQKDKQGGLLAINIPIKSKAVESLFGEGGAGLKVSGYHQISFSGTSRWDDREETATYRQSKFPSLNMEQISRFDINGTIGSKITVSVSQDSKTDIPLANRLMIRYKGDEDDIIKSIEAGNTTLSLPNTQFVGYSSRIQGLFGVKTEAQIGSLNLTAIASQEKGTTERTSIDAGASASVFYLRDYQFADGMIYDLGVDSDFPGGTGDVIEQINLFYSVKTNTGTELGDNATMYVDPGDSSNSDYSSENEEALVAEISPDVYTVDVKEHWIIFDSPNAGTYNTAIGAYMIIRRANGSVDTVGNIASEPFALKLIKPSSSSNTYHTWQYMWRNVYYLKSRNLDADGLEINIYKGLSTTEGDEDNIDNQNGVPYIQILGLDRQGSTGSSGADGKADVLTAIIEKERGLLIFPDRKPFDPDSVFAGTELETRVPDIYTNIYAGQEAVKNTTYYLQVSSLNRASEISLGKSNIIEGSERITLNGRQLERGTDYRINYDFGQVTFLTEEATDPNADISLDFEYSPFITMQKKTLFGIRGEYEFSDNLKLGSTFLYKSDKATDRKPKVGQETSKMLVWDADISFRVKPNFMTSMANAIPFFTTEQESNLAVSAEIAQSYPNPNVDGVAYMDDFEGSRDAYSLGVYRESWYLASKPVSLDSINIRGRMIWFNPYTQVATNQIWEKEITTDQSGTHTLWMVFKPTILDRRDGGVDTTVRIDNPTNSWGGIMRFLASGASDQDDAQLLEIRSHGKRGILHIEMGKISEDVNGNGNLDTEDKNSNDFLDDGEDIGLDGLINANETRYESDPPPGYNESDPDGDDWVYNADANPNYYDKINGTENNKSDPGILGRPDTEDINRDLILNKQNDYFSFSIDLADPNSPFLVDSSENNYGWRTHRIPIRDTSIADTIVGSPLWSQIEYIRYWMESPTGEPCTLAVASTDIITSNWEDTIVYPTADSTAKFNVAVINTQENLNYNSPPGVVGFYDANTRIREPEQSLLLDFTDFKAYDSTASDTGIAERILYDTPNLMGYRNLALFVHGPKEYPNGELMFFFRVGQSSTNYYEVRQYLNEDDWIDTSAWIEVEMDFNDITGLKSYLELARGENADTNVIDSVMGNKVYRVYGKPNITQVKYLAAGIININQDEGATGQIWLDELRLTDVRRDVGLATRVSVSGNVADLFTYNAGYNYENSYFRKISSSTRGGSSDNLGSGKTTTGYSFGANFKLDRFVPRSYGANLPLSLRYSKNTSVPRLKSNSDIILPEELRDDESTISTQKSMSISEAFNKKTKNPLFTVLLNKLKTNFSYTRSDGTSPTTPMSLTESYRLGANYSAGITKVPSIRPFFWTKPIPLLNKLSQNKFYFFPNNYTFSGDLNRSLRISRNSSDVLTNNLTRDFKGTFRTSYKISDNLNANYNMDTRRDLSDPETVNLALNPRDFKFGRETNYNQSFGANYDPNMFAFLTHRFSFTTSYREDMNVSNNTRNMSATKSYGIGGNFDFKKLFGSSSGKRERPRQRVRDAEQGKGVTVVGEKKNVLKAFTGPPRRILAFLTGWIDPISYDFKEAYSYSYVGLLERAQAKFRFGLTEDIGALIDPDVSSVGRSTYTSKSTNYSFGSGTQLLGGLKTTVSFNRNIKRDLIKSVNPQKTVSTTFPDFNFTINQLSTFKILNPFIRSFSPRTKYSRSTSETINLATGFKTSDKTTVTQNPLLSFSFDLMRGLRIDVTTGRTVTEDRTYNSSTGELTRRSRNTSENATVSTKYSFSWPTGVNFPLFGRLKFSSTMTISLQVMLRKQKTEEADGDEPLLSKGDNTDLTITPTISYTFSSQIKGGITGRWQDTNNKQLQRTSHVRELRIWVDIRF